MVITDKAFTNLIEGATRKEKTRSAVAATTVEKEGKCCAALHVGSSSSDRENNEIL